MAFLLDNLTAVLVGATLLVALLFVQQRGGYAAVDASVRYQTEGQATTLIETLARDLENARTREQAQAALGLYQDDSLGGPRQRALGLHPFAGSLDTEWIQFVTLADPDASADPDPTTTSDLIGVAYRMEPTGEQVLASGEVRDLHRLVRYVYDATASATPADWVPQSVSPPTVLSLTVQAVPGGLSGRITELPPRVDVTVEMAFEAPARRAADQGPAVESGLTRQGATARLYAAGTGSLALPAPQGSPEIPRVPWVGEAPPPASGPGPSGPGPSGPGPGGPGPGGSGPGSSPTGPAPPPFDTTGTSAGGL